MCLTRTHHLRDVSEPHKFGDSISILMVWFKCVKQNINLCYNYHAVNIKIFILCEHESRWYNIRNLIKLRFFFQIIKLCKNSQIIYLQTLKVSNITNMHFLKNVYKSFYVHAREWCKSKSCFKCTNTKIYVNIKATKFSSNSHM